MEKKHELTNLPKGTPISLAQRLTNLNQISAKFRHFPENPQDEQWKSVRQTLYSIAIKIGLSDPLSGPEIMELVRFLNKEFPDINKELLIEAFDMYCAQKLDFTDSAYNKLSNLFMANVINSFNRYRTEVRRMERTEKEKEEYKPLAPYYEKLLFEPYDLLLKGEDYPWSNQQEWLIYTGMNKLGFPFATVQRKNEILDEVKAKMHFSPKIKKQKREERIKNRAMRECFREWVTQMAEKKTDIREYFKPRLEEIDNEIQKR